MFRPLPALLVVVEKVLGIGVGQAVYTALVDCAGGLTLVLAARVDGRRPCVTPSPIPIVGDQL